MENHQEENQLFHHRNYQKEEILIDDCQYKRVYNNQANFYQEEQEQFGTWKNTIDKGDGCGRKQLNKYQIFNSTIKSSKYKKSKRYNKQPHNHYQANQNKKLKHSKTFDKMFYPLNNNSNSTVSEYNDGQQNVQKNILKRNLKSNRKKNDNQVDKKAFLRYAMYVQKPKNPFFLNLKKKVQHNTKQITKMQSYSDTKKYNIDLISRNQRYLQRQYDIKQQQHKSTEQKQKQKYQYNNNQKQKYSQILLNRYSKQRIDIVDNKLQNKNQYRYDSMNQIKKRVSQYHNSSTFQNPNLTNLNNNILLKNHLPNNNKNDLYIYQQFPVNLNDIKGKIVKNNIRKTSQGSTNRNLTKQQQNIKSQLRQSGVKSYIQDYSQNLNSIKPKQIKQNQFDKNIQVLTANQKSEKYETNTIKQINKKNVSIKLKNGGPSYIKRAKTTLRITKISDKNKILQSRMNLQVQKCENKHVNQFRFVQKQHSNIGLNDNKDDDIMKNSSDLILQTRRSEVSSNLGDSVVYNNNSIHKGEYSEVLLKNQSNIDQNSKLTSIQLHPQKSQSISKTLQYKLTSSKSKQKKNQKFHNSISATPHSYIHKKSFYKSSNKSSNNNQQTLPQGPIFIFDSKDHPYISTYLKQNNWRQYITNKLSPSYTLKWVNNPIYSQILNLKPNQFYNHFHKSYQLTSKGFLNSNLKANKHLVQTYQFYPECYDIGNQIQREQFVENYKYKVMMSLLEDMVFYCGRDQGFGEMLERNGTKIRKYIDSQKIHQDQEQTTSWDPFQDPTFQNQYFNPIDLQNYKQRNENFLLNIFLVTQALKYYRKQRVKYFIDFNDKKYHYLNFNEKSFNDNFNLLQIYGKRMDFGLPCPQVGLLKEYFATPSELLLNVIAQQYVFFSKINNWKYSYDQKIKNEANIWIVKPSSNARGNGIYLQTNLNVILKSAKDIQSRIVQKYIQRPLILKNTKYSYLNNHKFDIRQWVLLKSLDPLQIYMLASQKYKNQSYNNQNIHLTNFSFNKKKFKSNQHSIVNSQDFCQFIQNQYKINWQNDLKPKIKSIIIKSIQACSQKLESSPLGTCFQLLGYDILIDQKINPWLIQVNMSPACQQRTKWLSTYLKDMNEQLLQIVLPEQNLKRRKQQQRKHHWQKIHIEQFFYSNKDIDTKLQIIGNNVWNNKGININLKQKDILKSKQILEISSSPSKFKRTSANKKDRIDSPKKKNHISKIQNSSLTQIKISKQMQNMIMKQQIHLNNHQQLTQQLRLDNHLDTTQIIQNNQNNQTEEEIQQAQNNQQNKVQNKQQQKLQVIIQIDTLNNQQIIATEGQEKDVLQNQKSQKPAEDQNLIQFDNKVENVSMKISQIKQQQFCQIISNSQEIGLIQHIQKIEPQMQQQM